MKQLDEVSTKYLKILYKMGYARIPNLTVEQVRKIFSDQKPSKPDKIIHVKYSTSIITLHLYFPSFNIIQSLILYLHGGGYVLPQSNQDANTCRRLADETKSCVILMEYSLAPEKKFPKAIKETTFVINWVIKNKLFLCTNKKIPIFIYGESSGANLAAATLLFRKKNDISGIILMCPSLDYYTHYRSKIKYSEGFLLDENIRTWFASHYLNNANEKENPLVSLTLSKNLSIFPPTLLVYSYFDPLRDEAKKFHKKLIENGVCSKLKKFNTIHCFLNYQIQPYTNMAYTLIKDFIETTPRVFI